MIAKILLRLSEFRQTMRSPAAQVAIAGALLTIGVRIVESVLTDVVEQADTGRALSMSHARFADHLHERVSLLEKVVAQHVEPPQGDEPAGAELPEDVEGWPVGRSVEVPVSAIRVEAGPTSEPIPGLRVTEFTAVADD
jgi:hypothetical protein